MYPRCNTRVSPSDTYDSSYVSVGRRAHRISRADRHRASLQLWALPPLPESPLIPCTVPTLRQTVISPSKISIPETPVKSAQHSRSTSNTSSTYSYNKDITDGINAYSPPKRPGLEERASTHYDQQRPPQRQSQFSLSSPRKLVSPSKVPLPPSPTRNGFLSPPKSVTGLAESSFMLPANMSESLIGETSMPTMLMDHSLDFGIDSIRGELPGSRDMGYMRTKDESRGGGEGSTTPTRVIKGSVTPTRTSRKVTASIVDRTVYTGAPGTGYRSNRDLPSPAKTPSLPRTAIRPSHARTTSASLQNTLPRQGFNRNHDLDVSTLLPSSPARTAHLLSDKHQLLRESLPSSEAEGPSFFLPPSPPPASTRKSPRKPNMRADMTMDINDLMAKMSKPKRPSGTEESFEDLLNAPGFELDQ